MIAYTEKNAMVPGTWIDSDPKLIQAKAEQVKLKSFTTNAHQIDSLVTYSLD
jgi:mitotic spindle assembly checkpoint protein MAD2